MEMHVIMNKKIIIIPIVVLVTIFLVDFSADKSNQKDVSFHVTLADPELYINGVYSETFTIEKGEYSFRFVPNGSSPKVLSIVLNGDIVGFSEDFELIGRPHQTGISEYFTWDYDGEREISVSEKQKISIVINPNNETL